MFLLNEEKTIRKTLLSLVSLDWPKDKLEIIVINDGSKDKTAKIVTRFIKDYKSFNIRLINQKNQGKAAALNTGLQQLKGKYFACLDADSFVAPETLKRMIFWHEQDKKLAITTPVMKVHQPKNWIQKFQRLEYITGMLLTKLMSYIDCNYVAPGPFSVYKTAIIKKIGGFDEKSLVEDQEIAYRVQKHHYKIIQVPKAVVLTVAPHNLSLLKKQRNRWFKGSLMNIIKYRELIFNKKYGDFGVFQMPLNIFAFLLAGASMVTFAYYTIKPLFDKFYNLWLVDFDLIPYLQNWEWSFDILRIQVTPTFILYLMLSLTVFFLYLASRTNDDKIREHGWFYIIPYFFVYF